MSRAKSCATNRSLAQKKYALLVSVFVLEQLVIPIAPTTCAVELWAFMVHPALFAGTLLVRVVVVEAIVLPSQKLFSGSGSLHHI